MVLGEDEIPKILVYCTYHIENINFIKRFGILKFLVPY